VDESVHDKLVARCFWTPSRASCSSERNGWAPVMKQLASALKLDTDMLCLWAHVIPADIRAEGVSQEVIRRAWQTFREVIERERKISPQ
jgi:hypothetical protein